MTAGCSDSESDWQSFQRSNCRHGNASTAVRQSPYPHSSHHSSYLSQHNPSAVPSSSSSMSVTSAMSRSPGMQQQQQARNADSSIGRPPSNSSSSSAPFSGTSRLPGGGGSSSIPPYSSPPSSAVSSSPASTSDDRSAAIAEYVEKRRQAKLNADSIRKERAREAEIKRAERQERDSGQQLQQRLGSVSSSSSVVGSSPSMPRSGIVTGASSGSSSGASSATSSRRASRGREGSESSGAYTDGHEVDRERRRAKADDDEEQEEAEPLHRYAKPLSRTTAHPASYQQPSSALYQSQQQRFPTRPLSPSAAASTASRSAASLGTASSTGSLQSRVTELEAQVAALQSQQRLFLAFMETSQTQLSLLRGAAQPVQAAAETAGSARLSSRRSQQPLSTQRSTQSIGSALRGDDSRQRQYESKDDIADRSGRRSGSYGVQRDKEEEEEEEEAEADLDEEREETAAYSSSTQPTRVTARTDRAEEDYRSHTAKASSTQLTTQPPQLPQPPLRSPSRSPPPPAAAAAASASSYFDSAADAMESDPFPVQTTYPCSNCGRSFNEDALERHVAKALCQKAARKPFDPTAQRLQDVKEQLSHVGGGRGPDRKGAGRRQQQQQQADEAGAAKQSKWRQERARLQEAIQAGKQISQALKEGKPLASIPVAVSSVPDDRVQCPHCLRRFAEQTAERHIPHCKNTQSRLGSKLAAGGTSSVTQKRK